MSLSDEPSLNLEDGVTMTERSHLPKIMYLRIELALADGHGNNDSQLEIYLYAAPQELLSSHVCVVYVKQSNGVEMKRFAENELIGGGQRKRDHSGHPKRDHL